MVLCMIIPRMRYAGRISRAFDSVPIVLLVGARQTGKTTLMRDFSGAKKALFLNGQDPETAGLFEKLSLIEPYLRAYLDQELRGLLLLDEFQFIPGVSTMLKLLSDKHPGLQMLCSGSSSLDIYQKVEESLAGRVRTIEVLSLSFAEYVLFADPRLAELYNGLDMEAGSSALTAPIEDLLSEYLVYGGLPRAALAQRPEDRIDILNDIYQTYLLRDVRSFIALKNTIGFNRMLIFLALQIGSLVNVNALSRECELPYKMCEEYLYLLEQMGIIRMLEPYAANRRKAIVKMKKVYFCDLGLRNLIAKNFTAIDRRTDAGALFENYAMLELWRNKGTGGDLRFYRTSDGAEVDFVLERLSGKAAVECKFRHFEKPINLAAFTHFCEGESIPVRYILNRSLSASNRGIRFLPGFLADRITTG